MQSRVQFAERSGIAGPVNHPGQTEGENGESVQTGQGYPEQAFEVQIKGRNDEIIQVPHVWRFLVEHVPDVNLVVICQEDDGSDDAISGQEVDDHPRTGQEIVGVEYYHALIDQ